MSEKLTPLTGEEIAEVAARFANASPQNWETVFRLVAMDLPRALEGNRQLLALVAGVRARMAEWAKYREEPRNDHDSDVYFERGYRRALQAACAELWALLPPVVPEERKG